MRSWRDVVGGLAYDCRQHGCAYDDTAFMIFFVFNYVYWEGKVLKYLYPSSL
jgi:hypothetical protein